MAPSTKSDGPANNGGGPSWNLKSRTFLSHQSLGAPRGPTARSSLPWAGLIISVKLATRACRRFDTLNRGPPSIIERKEFFILLFGRRALAAFCPASSVSDKRSVITKTGTNGPRPQRETAHAHLISEESLIPCSRCKLNCQREIVWKGRARPSSPRNKVVDRRDPILVTALLLPLARPQRLRNRAHVYIPLLM